MADDLSQLTQLTATTQTTNTITKAQREEVEALFNLVDTDGSGEIDEDELEELFALVGVDVSPEEISEVMREADADGSGEIDREEFAEVMLALPPCRHSPNEVLRCFRLLAGPRAPRNGRMEHAQLIHALVNLGRGRCAPAEAKALAEQLKPRKDGTVAYARFLANTMRHSGAAEAAAGEADAGGAAAGAASPGAASPGRRAAAPGSPAARRPRSRARPLTAPAALARRPAREVRDVAVLDRLRQKNMRTEGAALVPQYSAPVTKLPG